MKDSISYIKSFYFTIDELAQRTSSSIDRIAEMIKFKCLPDASYRIQTNMEINSFLGKLTDEERVGYFAKSHVSRIKKIEQLKETKRLEEIAEQLKFEFITDYKNKLIEENANKFGYQDYFTSDNNLTVGGKKFLSQEWKYYLEGVYGLCTQTAEVHDIVLKELLIKKIQKLTNNNEKKTLLSSERTQLLIYVRELDKVQAYFAPHEREKSSRYKSIDAPTKKYNLKEIEIFSYD